MRPLWERTLTWGVADRLRRAGLGSDSAAYSAAALVVRDLDRRYGLTTIVSRYRFAPESSGDVNDTEQAPPPFTQVQEAFWLAARGPYTTLRAERDRLLTLAAGSLLASGPAELDAARALAAEAKTVEGELGPLNAESWTSGEHPGYESPSVPITFTTYQYQGLAGLRDEVIAASTAPDVAARGYDDSAGNPELLALLVKGFQFWAKGLGHYTGAIDGLWGPKTEAGWNWAAPGSVDTPTTLAQVSAVYGRMREAVPTMEIESAVRMGIARDIWLASRGIVAPSTPVAEEPLAVEAEEVAEAAAEPLPPSSGIVVSIPWKPTASLAPTRFDVVDVPEREDTVTVTPVAAGWRPSRAGWGIVGGLVVAGGVVAVAAWRFSRRRTA
ncbi:MAG: hypothetical protein ABIF82_03605 [Planctomycetota bacterium]